MKQKVIETSKCGLYVSVVHYFVKLCSPVTTIEEVKKNSYTDFGDMIFQTRIKKPFVFERSCVLLPIISLLLFIAFHSVVLFNRVGFFLKKRSDRETQFKVVAKGM